MSEEEGTKLHFSFSIFFVSFDGTISMEGSEGCWIALFALRKNAVAIFNAPLLLNESSKLSCVFSGFFIEFCFAFVAFSLDLGWTLA